MKILKIVLLLILCLLLLVVAYAWTPDTSFDDMREKYANEQSQFIQLVNNDRIHYRDQGDKSAPVLILIHGTSSSLHTWEPLIGRLKDSYRLVSFDLPGHGLSGAQSDRDYSMSKYVKTVERVMDKLMIEKATLVGNSLGGAVAWEGGLALPDRIESLVLIAPSGAPRIVASKSNIGFKLLSSPIGPFLVKKFTPRMIIKTSLQQTVHDQSLVTEPMVDRYWELLRMEGNRQAMLDLAKTPRRGNTLDVLTEVRQPALIIWGAQDNLLTVDMAKFFESKLSNSRLKVLKDVGHLPMEESVTSVSGFIHDFIANRL